MGDIYLRVKGIIKKDGKYLLIKRWVDDRIPDPFVWEFVDMEVNFGEAPDEAMLRAMEEILSVEQETYENIGKQLGTGKTRLSGGIDQI